MLKAKCIYLMPMVLLLGGCGSSYDCNSSDVRETIIKMFSRNSPAAAQEAYAAAKLSGVVTLDKDGSLGRYVCKADMTVPMPNGKSATQELTYTVSRVDSDDAKFEVEIDEKGFNVLRFNVNVPINQAQATQAHEQKKSALAEEFAANPPAALDEASVVEQIKVALEDQPGGFDESQFHLVTTDLNNDSFKEYVAVWRDTWATDNEIWKVKFFYQSAMEPGGQAKLEYSLESSDDFGLGKSVKHVEMKGNELIVSDGEGWSDSRTFSAMPISPRLIRE